MSARHRARLGSPLRLHGSVELFGKSRKLVQKNIWIFGPLYALLLLFSFHAWAWTPAIGSQNGHWWTIYSWFGISFAASSIPSFIWYAFVGTSAFWLVFVFGIGTIIQIMSQQAQLDATERKPLNFVDLWRVAKELGWRLFGLYLLMALYIFVGFVLLIIPGFIMMRRYFLAPYILLDTKCGITEAMERSAEMTRPYSGYIYGMITVMLLIGALNAIPGVGWMIAFLLGMAYSVAPALRYQELKEAHGMGRHRLSHQESTEN